MTTSDPGALAGVFDAGGGLPEPLPSEPMTTLDAWLDEAWSRRDVPNPNAMTLASVDAEGRPAARIVLCKSVEPERGSLVFYTNYRGRKGRELEANPHVACVLHWDHLQRQVRVEGVVTKTSAAESDAYFRTRSWESRLGAWASDQSEPIASREALLEKVAEKAIELGVDLGAIVDGREVEIPRPPHWGGYRVWADRVELWVGACGRVHDRARWTRELTRDGNAYKGGAWSVTRLQP
ncbi:MAG: pyridoxamine 5'-phosphate oxidase [Phycisphaerales bacterium]